MSIYPPGFLIAGRYEVASRPLMGGMGIVYLCMDREEDRPVALKSFKPEYLPDRTARNRFLREGTTWVELGSYPHIVRCYQVFYDDPTAWLMLELVAKEQGMDDASLRSWIIPGRPLPVEQALLFALQIARGMHHACQCIPGFVHRDLKPENVLVGADKLSGMNINRLRVTDFGLARILGGSREPGRAGSTTVKPSANETDHSYPSAVIGRTQLTQGIVGTPLYMAPEQWKGEAVGVYTDIYALGCILFEMLSGQHAVQGQTISELQFAHCTGRLRPLPTFLPREVTTLLARCLALDGSRRYAAWGEVTMALESTYIACCGEPAPRAGETAQSNRAERLQVGWSYNAIGLSYMDMGKSEVSVNYFEKALAIWRGEATRELIGVAVGNLGLAYAALGEDKQAIGYYEQALTIDREIGDRHAEGADLGNLGVSYENLGEIQRAIKYYEQALAIAREVSDRKREGVNLVNLGHAYGAINNAELSVECCNKALSIFHEIGDRRGESAVLHNLGDTYRKLGGNLGAIRYLEQALNIHREIGDRRGEGADLGSLGDSYASLGETQRAIGYYEKALVIDRELDDRLMEENDLSSIGNSYANLGEARRAIEYYELAKGIDQEINNLNNVAFISYKMAHCYAKLGEKNKALSQAVEAANIWKRMGDVNNTQRAQALIAGLEGPNPISVKAAFGALISSGSKEELIRFVGQYPFMIEDGFIQAGEIYISEQIPMPLRPEVNKHLTWLRQIAGIK